ncbi:restriction endonuclease [Nocardia fusca]
MLVTTSRFTRSARQTAERTGIRLVDNTTLAKWNAGTIPAPWT